MVPWSIGHRGDHHIWPGAIKYWYTLRRHTQYGLHTKYHLLTGHHSVMLHYLPFFLNWPTISNDIAVKGPNPPDTDWENKYINIFVLLIKSSWGGNSLCTFRGDVSRAGRNLIRRPSLPLCRRCGLVHGIVDIRVWNWVIALLPRQPFLGSISGEVSTVVESGARYLYGPDLGMFRPVNAGCFIGNSLLIPFAAQ